MKRIFFTVGAISLCLVMGLYVSPVWGIIDFSHNIGFDAGANARGGTSIAIGDEPSNLNFNPAVMDETIGNALELNLEMIFLDNLGFSYRGTNDNWYHSDDKDRLLLAPGITFVHHGKNSRLGYGLTFAAIDNLATDYTIHSRYFGDVNASSNHLHLRGGPAISYQILPNLALGARLGIDWYEFDIRMPFGRVYLDDGEASGWGVSAGIGLLYKPTNNLTLGLFYETPTFLEQLKSNDNDAYVAVMLPTASGDVKMEFTNMKGHVGNADFPQCFGIGAAWRPIPSLRLSCDVKYIDWDEDWDKITLSFSEGDSGALKAALGTNTLSFATDVDSQWVFGIGLEYYYNDMFKFALGYHYNDESIAEKYYLPYAPGWVDHTITGGVSVTPMKHLTVSLAYMYSIFRDPSLDEVHGAEESLENQLGLPSGFLDSELNHSDADFDVQTVSLSVTFKW